MIHEIPIDSKSETRLFVFFSLRALATTVVASILGMLIGAFVSVFTSPTAIMIVGGIFGFIGFVIGTFPIPNIKVLPVTRSISGLYLYEVVFRYFKFKMRRKLYTIAKENK